MATTTAHPQIPAELLPADGRFGAGPSKVRLQQIDALRDAAQSVLGTSHRQPPVKQLVGRVREGLAELFRLPEGYEVVLGNGGATAFWHVASYGLIERRSQHLVFGEFGAKCAAAARTPWLDEPEVITALPGTIAEPQPHEGIDLYAWPQNETSTGAMAQVRRVAGGATDAGALTMIDATSAAGGLPVDLAECDVYYFSPQKNFGSDGGLWIAILSPAAIERTLRIASSDRYIPEFLSLSAALDNSRQNQTLNTPSITTLVTLADQLDWLRGLGGLPAAVERTTRSSGVVYAWAAGRHDATPFVSDPAERSSVICTIDFDGSVDAAAVAATLRANGIVDVEPYRKLGRNQLRIATFVNIDHRDVEQLVGAIDWVIEALRR